MKFIHIKDLHGKSGGKRDETRGARNSAGGIHSAIRAGHQ